MLNGHLDGPRQPRAGRGRFGRLGLLASALASFSGALGCSLVVDAERRHFTLCSAGHPPPMLALPEQRTTLLDVSPSPPIGVQLARAREDVTVALEPGATVGCYTDGLIERRGEPIDHGLDRLRTAFRAGAPETVCGLVMADMIGASTVEDDTALLVFRRTA